MIPIRPRVLGARFSGGIFFMTFLIMESYSNTNVFSAATSSSRCYICSVLKS